MKILVPHLHFGVIFQMRLHPPGSEDAEKYFSSGLIYKGKKSAAYRKKP
jgi:hypothetical protein